MFFFYLKCHLLLYRLHQLSVTFNMTNWFRPLAIVTSKSGSDPWNDEQVIIIDWILKVKQFFITVTANVYFTKIVNSVTKFLTWLWSCYSVLYKIALSINSTSGRLSYFTSDNCYKILWIMYQSIPSPIGYTLHKFGPGCSFEVIFGLPKKNNKLQSLNPKKWQATHFKPKKVTAFLVPNSNIVLVLQLR